MPTLPELEYLLNSSRTATGTTSDAASATGSLLARLAGLLGAYTPTSGITDVPLASSTAPSATTGLYKQVTLTNPGTNLTTALDITGTGQLVLLVVSKPSTTNSVNVKIELTLDGTVVVNDQTVSASSTSALSVGLVGARMSATAHAALAFLPFNSALKLRCRFSGTPGASENITVQWLGVYR